MLETLITILISINVHFGFTERGEIIMSHDNCKTMISSEAYNNGIKQGQIQDVTIKSDESGLNDIVTIPDIDPDKY
jgi:hypothetical protein